MKLKTQYDENKSRYYTNPGSTEHILYKSKFDDDGQIVLFEAGRQNIPEFINSHLESTDINVIIERFKSGDSSALNQRPVLYGDFTELPKTLADALNMSIEGRRYFDSLPVDEKKKFNNSYAQFLATFDKVRSVEAVAKEAEISSASVETEAQA